MIPDMNHPVWAQIVTGKKHIKSAKATVNLLIQGNKMSYERDPSPENIQKLMKRTSCFFIQYQAIFPDEVAQVLN
jgi:signal recognition particle receptor subunit beta